MVSQTEEDYSKPVAYDAEGRPLYHHPATEATIRDDSSSRSEPIPVDSLSDHANHDLIDPHSPSEHMISPGETADKTLGDGNDIDLATRNKHEESKRQYPYLNLSEGEYVILDIKRHPIGLFGPFAATLAMLVAIFTFADFYPSIYDDASIAIMPSATAMFMIALVLSALVILGGAVALWVYLKNQFFLTNESIIQSNQESLFSRHEQTVSLASVEDVSFRQSGILQTLLDYGTIRLSTQGQRTIYVFRFATSPRVQTDVIENAIEQFRHGKRHSSSSYVDFV